MSPALCRSACTAGTSSPAGSIVRASSSLSRHVCQLRLAHASRASRRRHSARLAGVGVGGCGPTGAGTHAVAMTSASPAAAASPRETTMVGRKRVHGTRVALDARRGASVTGGGCATAGDDASAGTPGIEAATASARARTLVEIHPSRDQFAPALLGGHGEDPLELGIDRGVVESVPKTVALRLVMADPLHFEGLRRALRRARWQQSYPCIDGRG